MTDIYIWLTEPFQFLFMQQALFMATIVAIICAVLSCYLILKGWSLMGDAISHAILPGVVLASILSIPLSIGAFIAGLFCAIAVGYLKENSRLKEDTIMGIIFSGMFAIGILLFTAINTGEHLTHILFGNLLGIPLSAIIKTTVVSLLCLLIIVLKRKDFLLYCFDPNHAKVIGLPIRQLHYGLLALLALTIVTAMQVVGVILVVAMLITPGMSAYLTTKRFDLMIIIAISIALLSAFLGVLLSYHLDSATGPTIVLIQAVLFLILFAKKILLTATK